ncbi:MAG: response regulator [Inhella sp.]|jgi:two-component system chemotaxis response regulator CheY|uniref:response regulator n=1 Tax=Inhella sp. TaxID=1921806 RepID=UPI0022CAEE71|nr:response regulator [Inhella sp.]MCZ8235177.1 response regulator [Inhella sp.]
MAQVLVVDDSSTVRDEVAGFLKKSGLDVATAVDGRDGLAKLKMDPKIKLVVSDVNMPNMDGLTMAEKIRGELGNSTVNIVMLTTENSPVMKERGKAAGIKGWIVKPFKGDAVIATFKKLCE